MNDLEKYLRERRMRKNAFTEHNFFELESVETDRVVYRLDIREESRNPYGMVHGGALYTLADDAAGTAAHTGPPGPSATGAGPPCWRWWTSPARTELCWPQGNSPISAWTGSGWRNGRKSRVKSREWRVESSDQSGMRS